MSKKLFKSIAIIILIINLVNLIFPVYSNYAIDDLSKMSSAEEEEDIVPSKDFMENILFDGTNKVKQEAEAEPMEDSGVLITLIPNVIITMGSILASALELIFNMFVPESLVTSSEDFMSEEIYVKTFTLDKLFFGDIELLDANFFNYGEDETSINSIIKKNVSKWYVIMSGVALTLLLVVMIYLAINMALMYSGLRTPEKHANIKSTLTNVVISVAMIFLLPLILSLIAGFNDVLISVFNKLRITLVNNLGKDNFEILIRIKRLMSAGFNYSIYNLTYILLIIVYARFFMVYLKRFFTLAFLTTISPLIAVTFAVDKLKDDKSQVIGKFYREYFFSYFLQTLHSFIFIIFIGGLGAVASASPLMGLFLLSMLGRVEKIVKGVFDSRDLVVIRSSEEFLKGGKF